ncbi:alpha/beta hydrolase [Microbacterium natoriense]|uniref:alpha/beta fold hydrolase n=1 Tax=Microbacterium TaxID=33882 RepID=UPI000CFD5681|nr:alpha/beta hydrolase [Microbacterium sp. MYb72]PRB11472.1 alpha/beta hydrolase [Microbacterium sp. MYb72]
MGQLDGFLDRPGSRIAFADHGGRGRPIVLTHGAGMDHRMYDDQVRALSAAGFRPIVWDLRGHGESTLVGRRFTAEDAVGDLKALLASIGTEGAVLVGHSLGGNLSQAVIREAPSAAHGLVVIDASWNAGPLSAIERFALRIAAPSLAMIPARVLPGLMARASATTPAAVARTEEVFARMPKRVFLDVWRATASLIAPEPGYRTPVPLGLMRGAEDRTGNISTAMPAWADAEGVVEHVIAGAGHIVTWDAPDAASTALLRILDGAAFRGRVS